MVFSGESLATNMHCSPPSPQLFIIIHVQRDVIPTSINKTRVWENGSDSTRLPNSILPPYLSSDRPVSMLSFWRGGLSVIQASEQSSETGFNVMERDPGTTSMWRFH